MSTDLYPAPVAPPQPPNSGRPVWLLIPAVLVAVGVVAVWWLLTGGTFDDDRSAIEPVAALAEPIRVAYWELRIGDCFLSATYGDDWAIDVVPCSTPHGFEMYEVFFLDPATDPTASTIGSAANTGCETALPAGVGSFGVWVPTPEELTDGFLDVGCYAILDADRTGSIREPLPPGPIADQVAEVVIAVEELRGLPFLSIPEIELLTPDDVTDRYVELSGEPDDPVCELFRPGDPCGSVDTVAGDTVAFYDSETGVITVPMNGDRLDPWERATLAHELTHSLTDGHFRWAAAGNQLWWEGSTDAWFALNAVIEGDAQLVEIDYLDEYLSEEELIEYKAIADGWIASAGDTPSLWEAEVAFTYDLGLEYAMALHDDGGYEAIDQAYRKPVPATEWILAGPHAINDRPLDVDGQLPFAPTGYYVTWHGDWGTLDWYRLLWEDPAVAETVAGWGGGGFALYESEDGHTLLTVTHVGDDEGAASRLFDALTRNLTDPMAVDSVDVSDTTLTASGADYLWIARDGATIRLIAADNPADGQRVALELAGWQEGVDAGLIPAN